MENLSIITKTHWRTEDRLLVTRLQGCASLEDVQYWIMGLREALKLIPHETTFRVIVDFYQYEPADLDAHKVMRAVMPITLARHGFRTALFDLFDSVDVPIRTTRATICTAVAHVHHDAGKMQEYERQLGRRRERFFTDYAAAEAWLLSMQ